MRRTRSIVLAATALIVAVIAGGEAVAERHDVGRSPHQQHGGATEPQPAPAEPAPAEPAPAAPDTADEVERAFVTGMVRHHQAAIEMAQVVLNRGRNPKVRTLAQSIIDDQENEINWMSQRAQERWGFRPERQPQSGPMGVLMGLPLSMDMSMMADHMAQTTKVDRMFLEMMIPHHAAAISMAQELKDRGSNPRLLRVAGAVISTQAREIARMQDMLDRYV